MTEGQKKMAIIAVVAVIALFILLSRKGSNLVNQQNGTLSQVSIPSLDLPSRSITVNVPGLPSYSPYAYAAVSPCMCNGGATNTSAYSGPLVQFVTNQGSRTNYYDYTQSSASVPLYSGVASRT